ncbi:MAG: methylmalonyl-CoA epimerase [Acidobacteriota bacterium]
MKIDHLGIAVRSIENSLKFYRDAMGLVLNGTERVEDQGVTVALLPVGESRIELLEPFSEDTVIGRFLAKRGEGLHHICYEVENLEAKLTELNAQGIRVLDGYPRPGAEGKLVAFLHPADTGSVLIELSETINHEENK